MTITTVLSVGTMGGIDVDTYLDAAAAAGFAAVSLRPPGIDAWTAAGHSLASLRRRLGDLGLALAEVDPVTGWSGGTVAPTSPRILDVAAALGARAVSALVLPDEHADEPALTEGFAALCDEASHRGLLVQLEAFAWSPVRSLALAGRITREPANGGVLVDTWHVARAGEGVADVAALDTDQVLALQVSDGPATPAVDDIVVDCIRHRRWPGEGRLDPGRIVGTLLARGWSGPVGVEVFGSAADAPVARAHRAHRSLLGLLPAR